MKSSLLILFCFFASNMVLGQVYVYFHKSMRNDDIYTQKAIRDMEKYCPQITFYSKQYATSKPYETDTLVFPVSLSDTSAYFEVNFETKKYFFSQKFKLRDLNRFCWKRTRTALYIQLYITGSSNELFDICFYGGRNYECGTVWGQKKKR